MAMQCTRCHHTAPEGSVCPECGGPMRMTVLANVHYEEKSTKTIRIESETTSGFFARLGQWLLGSTMAVSLMLLMAFALVIGLTSLHIEVLTLWKTQPTGYYAALFGIPVTAIALAALVSLQDVYLAQLVGACVGVTATFSAVGVRLAAGVEPGWYEWTLLPLLGALTGFVAGLRVAGRYQEPHAVEYKPIDTWDRDARPKAVEMKPPASRRWNRLMLGIAVALAVPWLSDFVLRSLLQPIYHNASLIDGIMVKVYLPLATVGLLFGGVTAGAGTRSGFSQGLLTGAATFLIQYIYLASPLPNLTTAAKESQLEVLLLLSLITASVGGVIGRRIFAPPRVFREDVKEAELPPKEDS